MCLSLNYNAKVEKSEKSIKVYKVLAEHSYYPRHARSPYFNELYKKGELKEVSCFSDQRDNAFVTLLPSHTFEVNKGLHTYTSLRSAKEYLGRRLSSTIIVECTIPRRTLFIRGLGSQIATLKLRVGKAIHSNREGLKLKKRFNSNDKRASSDKGRYSRW